MKIKIKNVFAANESEVVVDNLEDDKNAILNGKPGDPNLTINCKTKDGFPCFINMPRTACLTISLVKD